MNPLHRQNLREQELERKGWYVHDTISIEAVNSLQSKGKYPQGSIWIWSTQRKEA
jgi:hypothetical protein